MRTDDRARGIELTGVSRRFGPLTALADVDLVIDPGSRVAVMGGNGAGKTTLIRTIAGLAAPTAGTVRVAGVDRRRAGPGVRARIGYVGHDSMLYGDLTIRENLAFAASLHDLPAGVVEPVAERLDLGAVLDRPARTLSRGNRQRAALARALLHQPAILLLDEPYTGLDLTSAQRFSGLLDSVHREGRTIVMAVHDVAHALAADRLLVLAHGRVVVDEAPTSVAEVTAMVLDAQRGQTPPGARQRPAADSEAGQDAGSAP